MNPITRKDYEKYTKEQWRGAKDKSRRPLGNSIAVMPADTTFTVVDKAGGFTIESEPCPKCGLSLYIRKVMPGDITLIEPSEKMKQ